MNATQWVLGWVLVSAMVTLSPSRAAAAITTSEEAALVPAGLSANAALGASVASSGDGARVVVGAPTQGEGRAYVFVRSGTSWAREATLVHPDAASGDAFGERVGMSDDGTRIVVGASGKNRAYVFVRSGTSWMHETTFVPSAGNVAGSETFGAHVAISGDGAYAVVGSPNYWGEPSLLQLGRVSIFRRTGTTWVPQQVILGAVAGNQFGGGVALDATGTRLVVAIPFGDEGAGNAGGAWLYVRTGTTWAREASLVPSGLEPGDEAGRGCVAISANGDRVLIGIRDARSGSSFSAGAGTIFVRAGTAWTEEARLVSSTPRANEYLGEAVALSSDGSRALLGGRGGTPGSARVYLRRGSVWTEEGVLTPAGGRSSDAFGTSVAIAGNGSRGFIGGPGHDGTASEAGAARVFTLGDLIGTTCASGELCMNGICVDGVCCESACGGGAVDCLACSAALNGVADGRCLPARSGTPCRARTDLCDEPEVCDGALTLCPPDRLALSGATCRPALDRDCDVAELCDGVTAVCPEDVFADPGTMCGDAPSGMCDVMDVCEGSRCRPTFRTAGTECGDATVMGVCDTPDVCTGDRADCPPTFLSGVVCRTSIDGCDLPEVCSGTSRSCPPDQVAGAGVVCRASVMASCDRVESCDGASAACPADVNMCVDVPDAGPIATDAGTLPVAAGCSCRAVGANRTSLPWLGLILLGLLARRRAIPPRHVG